MASVDENKNSHRKITMTHNQNIYPNRIALRAGKKGAGPAEVGILASMFGKSATELKQKLLKYKRTMQIATFNVRTLNKIGQLPELTASAIDQTHQLEPTYISSLPIRDVALKTYRKQWTIGRGGERGSGISMLIA